MRDQMQIADITRYFPSAKPGLGLPVQGGQRQVEGLEDRQRRDVDATHRKSAAC